MVEIKVKPGKIFISQQLYLKETLTKYVGTSWSPFKPLEPRTVLQAKEIGTIESPLLDEVEVKSYHS